MIGRLRCYYRGHSPALIAWDFRGRIETWGCSRCPWATTLVRRLGELDRIPPGTRGHREAVEFAGAVVGVTVIAVLIGLAGGSHLVTRP